jgi:hypothetical protein|tara:strand:+ start:203 stop:616 length:414 start_codon:yes stop_codon:yes gene_type:complete
MKHLLLILISIFLLPISVFGFDWTVKYDMKQSDVRYDTVILSVPKVIKSFWTLPNQVGIWKCSLSRDDDNDYGSSSVSLHCRSKEDETILLTSKIECNTRGRKNNELGVVYPKTIKNNKNSKNNTYPETIVTLKCEL